MPLTVTAWPSGPDPRGSHFSLIGYKFGQVPPDRYFAQTTGALAPYEELNDGILLVVVAYTINFVSYQSADTVYFVDKVGFLDEQTGPPAFSVVWELTIDDLSGALQKGQLLELFPAAIANRSITTAPLPGEDNLIPNPVTFQPRNFGVTV